MAKFIEGDPPITRYAGSPEMLNFANDLRHNPRKWAVHPGYLVEFETNDVSRANSASTTVANINNGRTAALREGFEARSAQGVVYVRWIGEPDDV